METITLKITGEERWVLYSALCSRISEIKLQLINAEIEYYEIDNKEQELYQLIELANKLY